MKRLIGSCTCLWSVTEVIGGDNAGGGDGVSVSHGLQLNVQASRSMIRKSSVSDRQQLLKVKQGLLRPRYRFSSTHRPKWPLKEESAVLLVQNSAFWTVMKPQPFSNDQQNYLNSENKLKRKGRKNDHYLPPPMAKESRSPLMKKEFSPVHLKHCHQNKKAHLKCNR